MSIALSSMTNADLDRKIIEQEARQGDLMLRAVYEFLGRFVLYPSEHAQTAHCPPSGLLRQIGRIEEGSVSGSS